MPTRDERRAFAEEHVLYEVWMLRGLTDRLLEVLAHDREAGGRDTGWLELPTRNAQVESFAIHARALLEFFYKPDRPRPDDALARHYCPRGWEPPKVGESLEVVKQRVGKEVAHLTYGRALLTEEARLWKYAAIWLDLATVLRTFLEHASPDLLPAETANRLRDLAERPVLEPPAVTIYAASARQSSTSISEGGPGTATYGSSS
jgi:hypothetical protein